MDKHLTLSGCAVLATAALCLTGCSGGSNAPTPSPTVTSTQSHNTHTPTVTSTPTSTTTSSRRVTVNPPSVVPLKVVTVYYVDPAGDLKTPGSSTTSCGASLVPTQALNTFNIPVKSAISSLVLNRGTAVWSSGLHNPLYQSNLRYVKAEVNGSTVSVWLAGTLRIPGECADQQAIDQLERTAADAAGTTHAKVYINDKLVENVPSLKG